MFNEVFANFLTTSSARSLSFVGYLIYWSLFLYLDYCEGERFHSVEEGKTLPPWLTRVSIFDNLGRNSYSFFNLADLIYYLLVIKIYFKFITQSDIEEVTIFLEE